MIFYLPLPQQDPRSQWESGIDVYIISPATIYSRGLGPVRNNELTQN